MKRFALIAFCLITAWYAIAQETVNKGGTITGIITTKGVRDARDVVVYIDKVEGEFAAPAEKPVVDQKNLIFIPHVLPVLKGTTVQFSNSDGVLHNIFSPIKPHKFNLGTYGSGVTKEVAFEKTGEVTLLCNVHAEMSAYIIVLQNPYFTITGPDGAFTIKNVPAGNYTLKTWHERMKEKEQDVALTEGITVTVDFKLSR